MTIHMKVQTRCAAAFAAFLISLTPLPLAGQTILGRVLDQANDDPVEGVIVTLVGRDGTEHRRALTGPDGSFVLAPPAAGEYTLVAEGFGYIDTQTPLLALTMEGEAPLELMLSPAPIGLEGLEVSVEEDISQDLSMMGITPAALGNRWINRQRIEEIPVKRDIGTILEKTAQSGVDILRPENLTPGSEDMGLCVTMARTRSFEGRGRCAVIVLNGVRIAGPQALNVDPNTIESVAVLSPIEGTVQYGTDGGAGVVLVWTRRGG